MIADWKQMLYEYVRSRNQMEVDGTVDPMLPFLTDEHDFRLQRQRLEVLNAAYQAGREKPVKSETKMNILHAADREREIVAYIQLYNQLSYKSNRTEHRLEKERLTFIRQGGAWRLASVDVDLSEKATNRFPLTDPSTEVSIARKSVPFLNHRMVFTPEYEARPIAYNRMKVKQYADNWWKEFNPQYLQFEVDCTNYVSQCLFAGNAPMNYTGRRERGWWYKGRQQHQELWSYSWAVSHSLTSLLGASKLGLRAERVETPLELTIGDVITYDWEGDGRFTHSVIVTALDFAGNPLVNAHTTESKHRFWDYRDSYAWSPKTQYRFFHIVDRF